MRGICDAAGTAVALGLAYGILSNPAASAAVGLAVSTPALAALFFAGLAILTTCVWDSSGIFIDFLHGRGGTKKTLSSGFKMCAIGACLGLLAGSGLVFAACFFPPLATACLTAVGGEAVTLLAFTTAAFGIPILSGVVCGIGAVIVKFTYGFFHTESDDRGHTAEPTYNSL